MFPDIFASLRSRTVLVVLITDYFVDVRVPALESESQGMLTQCSMVAPALLT